VNFLVHVDCNRWLIEEPTQLVKVCVHASMSWHWAHQSGLQEGAPAINQASFSSYVILMNTESLISIHHTAFKI